MMALVAIVSCSKESAVETPGGSVDALTFKASFENAGSRVSVSEEGGAYKMAWSSNDELAIYTRKTKTRYTYDPTNDVFTKSGFNSGPSLTTHYCQLLHGKHLTKVLLHICHHSIQQRCGGNLLIITQRVEHTPDQGCDQFR